MFVRSDAIHWFLHTWQRTLAAWASLLHVTTLPLDGSVTTLNLIAAAQAIDIVIAGRMEPALPRKFGYLRLSQFLDSVKSSISLDKVQGLLTCKKITKKNMINNSLAYSTYISAQAVATKSNDLQRDNQIGRRFQQLSIQSPLLLIIFTKTAETFMYVRLFRSFYI